MGDPVGNIKVGIGGEVGVFSVGSGMFTDESSQSFPVQPPVRVTVAVAFDMSGSEYEEVCEVLASAGFADLHLDEVPLLVNADDEFWTVTAPLLLRMLREDVEDILSEQSNSRTADLTV